MAKSDCSCSIYASFWVFEVRLNEQAAILLKNSSLLNLICSAFADHQNQAVIKISIDDWERVCAKVVVLVKTEEAEKNLLKNFSLNKIEHTLSESIYSLHSEVVVTSLNICQTGYISNVTEQEFEDILSDVRTTLSLIKDNEKSSLLEMVFSHSHVLSNSNRIFTAFIKHTYILRALVNGILQRPYSSNSLSSLPLNSGSFYESVQNFVRYYQSKHGRPDGNLLACKSNWSSWGKHPFAKQLDYDKTIEDSEFASASKFHSAAMANPTVPGSSTMSKTCVGLEQTDFSDDDSDSFSEEFAQCVQDFLASDDDIKPNKRDDSRVNAVGSKSSVTGGAKVAVDEIVKEKTTADVDEVVNGIADCPANDKVDANAGEIIVGTTGGAKVAVDQIVKEKTTVGVDEVIDEMVNGLADDKVDTDAGEITAGGISGQTAE